MTRSKSYLIRLFCGLLPIAVALATLEAAPSIDRTKRGGVAIKGYDPVAFLEEAKAVKGSKSYSYDWGGASWRFTDAEHLKLFILEPGKYLPKYGGYCAWAVARGLLQRSDPRVWLIVDKRLHLFADRDARARWATNLPGHSLLADDNWLSLMARP